MTPLAKLLVESKEETVKEAVNRFLGWKLPKDFNPDCGISFSSLITTEPVGTNLLTATQAEEMIRFILDDSLIRKAYLLGLEDVLAAVSTNGGQDIIEMGNVTDPIGAENHRGYMKCIEHTEVILKKRIKEALDSAIKGY